MEKKIRLIFEILFVLVLCGYYFLKVLLPEIRETYGSSDSFIRTGSYQNMFEIEIDSKVHFAFVLNSKQQIYHLFFLNSDAKVLYNKNIENQSMKDAVDKAFSILKTENYLTKDSRIVVTRYGEKSYAEFLEILRSYSFLNPIVEVESNLMNLTIKYAISGDTDSSILRNFDLYSKEIISNFDFSDSSFSEMDAENLAVRLYQKIYQYLKEKELSDFDREHVPFPIQMLPIDEEKRIFPSNRSWYYEEDGFLFSYIEFQKAGHTYGFCFQGSSEAMKKGEC